MDDKSPITVPSDDAMAADEAALKALFDESVSPLSSDALERLTAQAGAIPERVRTESSRSNPWFTRLAIAALGLLALGAAMWTQLQEAPPSVASEFSQNASTPEGSSASAEASASLAIERYEAREATRPDEDMAALEHDDLAWHGEETSDGFDLLGLPLGSDDPQRAIELVDALIAELDDA